MNMQLFKAPQPIDWPTAVKLIFIGDDDPADAGRQATHGARLVEARSLDDGAVVAVLGFHTMARWLELGSYSWITGSRGIWARLQ